MTTVPIELTPAQERRRIRVDRAAKKAKRMEMRAERKRLRDAPKVITLKDLDPYQLEAYEGIIEWWSVQQSIGGTAEPLTVGGYSGCGKSTLLSVVFPALLNKDGGNVRVKYCAYTGKAVDVLVKKRLEAETMHSLIYHCIPDPDMPGETIFILKDWEEIECELIVVDEASMIPEDMQADLESLGIPILYTGDHGQLPPVTGKGNIMADPRFKLEHVHRQAAESGIIVIATNIRQGIPVKKGTYGKYLDASKVGEACVDDTELLASADMVICYTNKTRASLNERIREYKGYRGTYPEIGERLICIKNNKLTRMFNGLVLYVKKVEIIEGYVCMDLVDEIGKEHLGIKAFSNYFEGMEHPKIFGPTTFDVFEFAYAITGHKSQGSQWDSVVVIEEIMRNQRVDMKRRWLYTVTTRAAKKLTWISRFK